MMNGREDKMYKIKIDEERLLSTIALIENHLDGAVADFETGGIDNVEFLDDLIYVHRILVIASTHGWAALTPDEYEERMKRAKETK